MEQPNVELEVVISLNPRISVMKSHDIETCIKKAWSELDLLSAEAAFDKRLIGTVYILDVNDNIHATVSDKGEERF